MKDVDFLGVPKSRRAQDLDDTITTDYILDREETCHLSDSFWGSKIQFILKVRSHLSSF